MTNIDVPGYKIKEILNQTPEDIICRALADPDTKHKSFLLKIHPKTEKDTGMRFELEYELRQRVESNNLIKIYEHIDTDKEVILVIEDFKESSLYDFQKTHKIDLIGFLKLAISITDILAQIHKIGLVHKAIRPTNIFIDEENHLIKLGNFSVLPNYPTITELFYPDDFLKRILPYISPEQKGYTDRVIDQHTDLYSLGAVFFEVLSGVFIAEFPEAQTNTSSYIEKKLEADHAIPKVIINIINKLVSKDAKNRYQTAAGLKADLEICLEQMQTSGKIEAFVICEKDGLGEFNISSKLYGRNQEIKILLDSFQDVCLGNRQLLLVAGPPGIGKTVLVKEIEHKVIEKNGSFITGKFKAFQENEPYYGFSQALGSMVRKILLEGQESVSRWENKLLAALGNNAQFIVNLIPELELIIGRQVPVPFSGKPGVTNVFNVIFETFINVFVQGNKPLVIFLDDLQWADLSSLKMIEHLITHAQVNNLFIIGAYRDNEVDSTHPLIATVEKIKQAGGTFNSLRLFPVKQIHIVNLIVDSLNADQEDCRELAALLDQKSGGNPFFVKQLLRLIYEQRKIEFSYDRGWRWDINEIKAIQITENMVDFLLNEAQKLSTDVKEVLKIAACIGYEFDLEIISALSKKTLPELLSILHTAAQKGFIVHLRDNYIFAHDRIKEAFYSLIDNEDKKYLHYKIGSLSLHRATSLELNEKLFYILDHLNIGMELITGQFDKLGVDTAGDEVHTDKQQLIELNLQAAEKARDSMAYTAALRYLNFGLQLLGENGWNSQYSLMYIFCLNKAEGEYLSGNFEEADKLFDFILDKAKTPVEKAQVYRIKSVLYQYTGRSQEAIELGMEGLNILGFKLNSRINKVMLLLEFLKTKLCLGNRTFEQLRQIPAMTDPRMKVVARILESITDAAFFVNKNLFSLLQLKQIIIALSYGRTSYLPTGLSMSGILEIHVLHRYISGYRIGNLALELATSDNNPYILSEVYFSCASFIQHTKEHMKNCINLFIRGYLLGLESGNYTYCGYNAGLHITMMAFTGDNLEAVCKQCKEYLEVLKRIKNEDLYISVRNAHRAMLCLRGLTKTTLSYTGDGFDEDKVYKDLESKNKIVILCSCYTFKLPNLYLFGHYNEAIEISRQLEKYSDSLLGFAFCASNNFYYSLSLAALCRFATKKECRKYKKIINKNQKAMKRWADNCPDNYQNKYLIIAAELARIDRRNILAAKLYGESVEYARKSGFIHEEGIANELWGEFYIDIGQKEIARKYLRQAYDCYYSWGARAKTEDLKEKYAKLII